MKNAQQWLDQNYPKEERNEVLIIEDETKTERLSGELSLDHFNKLIELDLSNNDIIKLDVSDCYDLEKLIVANNSLTKFLNHSRDIVDPKKLTYLNMMNNNIKEISLSYFCDFSSLKFLAIGTDDKEKIKDGFYNRFFGTLRPLINLVELEVLDISSTDISKGLRHLPNSLKEFYFESYRPEAKVKRIEEKLKPFGRNFKKYKEEKLKKISNKKLVENYELENQPEINNLLIVGRTGNGKSALANVLCGTNKFKESEKSISETRYFQDEIFMNKGKKYRVVDTIGVGDTRLSKNQVLLRIAEAVYTINEGITQVFFVVGRRFTKEETDTFELLKTVIFESNIVKHTTIIRTHFTNFRNTDKCKIDRQELIEENKFLAEIINSCKGIIHIDAPPMEVDCERRLRLNEEDRDASRNKLLNHLESFHGNYKPYLKTWDQLYLKVRNYIRIKHELENDLIKLVSPVEISNLKEKLVSPVEISKIKEKIGRLEEKVVRETEMEIQCAIEIPAFAKIQIFFKNRNGTCQII
ncbi:AIG1 family-domain-containing protein [Gigaspora rosea]|uniref:AIG1 family-domain-containing protein n=1 Tax=Gigaspora rosea TaxID=44941 RepID=A0A397UUT4_9GLOM|nr:AIG1 family-domain-containing protein [Gigaspora rosea]CAG8475365.1 21203_t:CDS:1 [Gigaspora rosea]